jgi:hypothetical protein
MTTSLSRPQRSSQLSVWVWLIVGLLVLAIMFGLAAPQTYPAGSSYETALSGYSQWYAWMQQQGHPIQRWQRSYDQLEGKGQTLIQVANQERYAEPNLQSAEINTWVEKGNTLIVLAWDGQVSGTSFRTDIPSPQGAVRIETTRRYPAMQKTTAEFKDGAGGIVIQSHSLGQGRIIEGSYPYLGSNIYAQQSGNFQLLAQLATRQKGPIWVDEWLHGHRDLDPETGPGSGSQDRQGAWSYLSRQPVAVLLVQGLLLLLLLLWGQNQRFGKLLSLSPPPRNNSEQYIQALADTLNAHGHRAYVFSLLGQSLRTRLRAQLGLVGYETEAATVTDEVIAAAWSNVTGRPSQELLKLLEQTRSPHHLSDHALLHWAQNVETTLRGLS